MDFWRRAARIFKILSVRCEILGEEMGETQTIL
jgi:hypothetical protein